MAPMASPGMLEGTFGPDPENSGTLPSRYYIDPEIFEREKEEILFKGWQFAGHIEDFPGVGSYKTYEFYDQKVFLIRCTDQQIRAFYNVCRHRGHALLEGAGKVKTIVCPYHAWSYDIDGNLKTAANSENVRDFDHSQFCLSQVRVEEYARMVFVNFDRDAQAMKQLMGGLEDEIRAAVPGYDTLTLVRRDPFDINCNWKIVIENFAECYHCPVTHQHAMVGSNSLLKLSFETEEFPYYMNHIIRHKKHKNRSYNFSPDDAIQDVHLWWMWPNTLFMAHPAGDNFSIFVLSPDGPEHTNESIDFYCYAKNPGRTEWEMFEYNSQVINNEDVTVCESVQRNLHSRGFDQGRFMVDRERTYRSEHCLHHFDLMVWNTLNRGSPHPI